MVRIMFNKQSGKEKVQTEVGKYRFLISLLLAFAVTTALITYQDYKLSKYETIKVVCVNEDVDSIAEGTVINEENVSKYFVLADVNKPLTNNHTLTSLEAVMGKKTAIQLFSGETVTTADFIDVNEVLSNISNPVETSINASDLSQLVGGILREGDIIDISIVADTGEILYKIDGVYVTKAFNTSGELLDKNAEEGAVANENAMVINVIMSKMDEQTLNQNINNGRVRVAKTNNVVD